MSKKYKDSFGDRMKAYEAASNYYLVKRMPVVIRLDGSHFHTFTKGFKKPFDDIMVTTMQETMQNLCESIQGCVLGYTQSDEITLVLCDYQTLTTSAWFDNRLEKMCSIGGSMASRFFNRNFMLNIEKAKNQGEDVSVYERKIFTADFDCRVFNVPKEDVCNAVLWRQKDAEKNSVQALAQSLFSHKELMGISTKDLQDKMFTEKGINWNDYPTYLKRGSACYKTVNDKGRSVWMIDLDMPILSQHREYIEDRIYFETGDSNV